mmetsp:Transcript_56687/g.165877  ORF Transcript_56687/g.165877 Transcript_56687/m.165877 type:complete len:764 (+) Transcript_56687:57-2348(+)
MPLQKFCDCCTRPRAFEADSECLVCVCDYVEVPAKDDFYKHVNRKWLADESIVIPPEYPRWGSFIKLVDEALKNQIGLLQELETKTSGDADEAKLGKLWRTSMARFKDWEAGEGGYGDLHSELERLSAALPAESEAPEVDLARYLSRCNELRIACPVAFGKEANLKDTESIVLDLSPSGTSLPSRDYYLDSKFEEHRGGFKEHLGKVRDLIGAERLEEDFVDRVVRLETKIAMIQMKNDQSRQFDQYFTVTTLDGLTSKPNELSHLKDKEANYSENEVAETDEDRALLTSPSSPVGDDDLALAARFWESMFKELRLRETMAANYEKNYPGKTDKEEAQYRIMVFDGDYFRRVLRLLLRKGNRRDVRAYLQYQVIRSRREFCTKALDEEFFDFYSRRLGGQKEQKTPEKRTVNLINSWLGELMGKIYVSRYFSNDDKDNVHGLVKDVLAIMQTSLKKNDWLTEETKAKAQEKLAKFVVKLGYPVKWQDYEELLFTADDSLSVLHQKVSAFDYKKEFLEKLNSVKDKTKWEMNPQDVNAYFHPLNNEIVFPAAIMQPPFYLRSLDVVDFDLGTISKDTPDLLTAINFGGIGAVIAHEITHGYDDQGRKFDSDGNINDWWKEEDAALFTGKCSRMAEQAASWTFVDTSESDEASKEPQVHKMNPELTMGENLADLGGMSLACQALRARLGSNMTKDHLVAFFSSWATVWKSKETKAFIIKALATDPHAPCSFRANLVKNVDAFYEAFAVEPGDPMYIAPDKRVQMW